MTPSGGRGSYFDSVVRFISRLFAPSQNNIRARIYIYTCDGTYSCENSSCKRIPSRTTLSRESNREIDGLKSIERGTNFASEEKETSFGGSQNFLQNF